MERKYYFCSDQGYKTNFNTDNQNNDILITPAIYGGKDIRGTKSSSKIVCKKKVLSLVGGGVKLPLFYFDMTKDKQFAVMANKSNHTCTLSHETATKRDCKTMTIAEIINTHMPALATILQQ